MSLVGRSTDQKADKDADARFPFCTPVHVKYERVAKIGQGTFGEVFKAREKKTGKFVALKKVLMENEKEGFPITALREIKILQSLSHENIINLVEVCRSEATQYNRNRSTFYLVFDFCEHDLAGLLSNEQVRFSLSNIKTILFQLFDGLFFIHNRKILHRDMKASNMLITKDGKLKLADFGLARAFCLSQPGKPNKFTNRVVTLWYRPPELLLGDKNYTTAIDMWGSGCIMAEMWTRCPIMQGTDEQHQLQLISQLCGSVCPETWPGVENMELYNQLKLLPGQKRKVKERIANYISDGPALGLLDQLLVLCPSSRIDAERALDHEFFWTEPLRSEKELQKMLSKYTHSMFEFTAPPRKPRAVAGVGGQPMGRGALPPPPSDQTHFDRIF